MIVNLNLITALCIEGSDYGLGYKSTIDGVGEELQFVKIPTHKQFNKPLRRIRVTTKANDASALEVGPGVEKNAQNIAVGPTKDVISVNVSYNLHLYKTHVYKFVLGNVESTRSSQMVDNWIKWNRHKFH